MLRLIGGSLVRFSRCNFSVSFRGRIDCCIFCAILVQNKLKISLDSFVEHLSFVPGLLRSRSFWELSLLSPHSLFKFNQNFLGLSTLFSMASLVKLSLAFLHYCDTWFLSTLALSQSVLFFCLSCNFVSILFVSYRFV